MESNGIFYYGAQYHRPPNPPRDQHKYHLTRIKEELGFNIVKLFFEWSYMHPAPGVYDFAEQDEIFDICDGLGLNVLLQTRLESAPYWLERLYPEARYVSANGNAVELGPNGNTQCGGYPGLCLHNDAVRGEAEKFLCAIAAHFKGRRSLAGYDCWNEPHLEPAWIDNSWLGMGDKLFCYCPDSRAAFRKWLGAKYGDIASLDRAWTRRYGCWDEVNPPNRQGHYADWLDWSRFWFAELRKQMQWRYDTLKSEDPDRFVMSHSGAVPPFLPRANAFIHNWELASPVDAWGTSMAPRYQNWSLAECAGVLDATRSAARGKGFWVSELTGGSCNRDGFLKTPVTRPKDIRTWNWLGAVYGAKAIVYWCYLEESTGLEAGSYGLVPCNGRMTARAAEAAAQAKLLQENFDLLRSCTVRTDVAVLYDPENASLLFAMQATDQLYGDSHIGYGRCLWRNDLRARYVTYGTLDDVTEKVLIVPMCLTMDEKTAVKLKNYVKRGGVLVAEARTGLFDETGILRPELPSFGLAEAAGLTEKEARYSDPMNRPPMSSNRGWTDEVDLGPEITMRQPISAKFRVRGYLAPLALAGAESLGEWKGECLAAHHAYGDGEVYYFGTYLGLALFEEGAGAYEILSAILSRYVKPRIRGGRLRPRLIENEGEGILAVFNDDPQSAYRERIFLPGRFRHAQDIVNGDHVTITEGALEIAVEPEDVAVFRLS